MFNSISKRPTIFKRLVGVSLGTFQEMVAVVKAGEKKRLKWETRWRDQKLSIEDQVLLAMMYLRSYTTYLYLWAVFHVSESNAHRKSIKVENILIKSWLFSLPKKEVLQQELDSIIIDATEVAIERPIKKQKESYSWKKKMHTTKAQITIDSKWKILRTWFAKWHVHDKKLYDQTKVPTNKNTKKKVDSGYQWIQKNTTNVELPYKSSKLKKLTKEQKQYNHQHSKVRIKAENKIREIKIFDIFDETYRNKWRRFWLRFNLVCWIVNHNSWFGNF